MRNITNSFRPDKYFDDTYDSSNCSNANQGLPLGNLTSQLFVNIYMNKFDQFMKHNQKAKHYIRYADDFVILSANKTELMNQLTMIQESLCLELKLTPHPNKIILKTFASGVDFLGWINFSDHRVLRTATKRRINEKNKRKSEK